MSFKNRIRRLERIRFYQWESDNFEEIINKMSDEERTIDWGNGILTKVKISDDGALALVRV